MSDQIMKLKMSPPDEVELLHRTIVRMASDVCDPSRHDLLIFSKQLMELLRHFDTGRTDQVKALTSLVTDLANTSVRTSYILAKNEEKTCH